MISSRRSETSTNVASRCSACGAELVPGDRFCPGCGAPIPDAVESELLADLREVTLGEYDILGILGRGGMGAVYLAHEVALNRKVAIKVLLPSLLRGTSVVERFRREAQIAASLRHRHITSIFGLKETSRLHFFVMDYIEGRTLESIIMDEGRLEPELAMAILHDVAGALTYAHNREVTHRDIKPGNIIIDTDGMAVVTDFGVARIGKNKGLTSTGGAVGSPRYMSPEQWSGKATSLSDQYSLGVVAYEMLSGEVPFDADTLEELMRKQLFGTPQHIARLVPDCPRELAISIMRMLQTDPKKRWLSLQEAAAAANVRTVGPGDPLRQRLGELAKRGGEVQALPKTPHSPIPLGRITSSRQLLAKVAKPRRLWPWLAAAAILIASVIVISQVDFTPGPGDENRPTPEASDQASGGAGPISSDPGAADDAAGPGLDAALVAEPVDSLEGREDPAASTPPATEPQRATTSPIVTRPPRNDPPRPAVLQILVTPWANVWIDGVPYGRMNRGVDTLRAGRHNLRFENDGYATVDTTISLRAGEVLLLRIPMAQRDQ